MPFLPPLWTHAITPGVFFLLFCALTAYLVGSLTALNPSKGSILLAVILIWLMDTTPPNDIAQFAPMIIAIAVMLALNIISFKPDLSTYLHKPWAITLMVLPMTLALTFGLAMSTTVFYHVPKFIMGTHPDNNPGRRHRVLFVVAGGTRAIGLCA